MAINQQQIQHFEAYRMTQKNQMEQQLQNLTPADYEQALDLILQSEQAGGRLHITGIGKPAHIGAYGASLLSSTGTPCYELHGTEAIHGSSGQVRPGDVVIAISNSGQTEELKATVVTLKNNGAKVIGISGNDQSWLAQNSHAHILAKVFDGEGGPLGRAPRASILSELIVLQALSVLLQSLRDVTPEQYVKWHPGGTLGKL